MAWTKRTVKRDCLTLIWFLGHKRGHPLTIIEEAFLKTMTPSKKPNEGEAITFNRTFNPSHIEGARLYSDTLSLH